MDKIILNKHSVEEGINELIETQLSITKKLNSRVAYTEEECKERLELFKMSEANDYILNHLFGIQNFVYTHTEFRGVKIR